MLSADKQWDLFVMIGGAGIAYLLGTQPGTAGASGALSLGALFASHPQIAQYAVANNKTYDDMKNKYEAISNRGSGTADQVATCLIRDKGNCDPGTVTEADMAEAEQKVLQKFDNTQVKTDPGDIKETPDDKAQDMVGIAQQGGIGKNDKRQRSKFVNWSSYTKKRPTDALKRTLGLDADHFFLVSYAWASVAEKSTVMYNQQKGIISYGDSYPVLVNNVPVYVYRYSLGSVQTSLSVAICRVEGECTNPSNFTNVKPGEVYFSTDTQKTFKDQFLTN